MSELEDVKVPEEGLVSKNTNKGDLYTYIEFHLIYTTYHLRYNMYLQAGLMEQWLQWLTNLGIFDAKVSQFESKINWYL